MKKTTEWINSIANQFNIPKNESFIISEEKALLNNLAMTLNITNHFKDKKLSVYAHHDTIKGLIDFAEEIAIETDILSIDSPIKGDLSYFKNEEFIAQVNKDDIILANEEILCHLEKTLLCQIASPSFMWRVKNPYSNPLVGYRGAAHLYSLISDCLMLEKKI